MQRHRHQEFIRFLNVINAQVPAEKAVLAARDEGTGKRKIARQLGVGVGTVSRIISEAPSQ